MKNKSSEILILVVLILAMLIYVGNNYLLQPMRERIETAEKSITQKENSVKLTYASVLSYGSYVNRLKTVAEEGKKYSQIFFGDVGEADYLDTINFALRNCMITISSLNAQATTFSPGEYAGKSDYVASLYADLADDAGIQNSFYNNASSFSSMFSEIARGGGLMQKEIQVISMSMNGSGTYADVKAFLRELQASGSLTCNSLSIETSVNAEDTSDANYLASFSATFNFVSIPRVDELTAAQDVPDAPSYVFPMDILNGSYRN